MSWKLRARAFNCWLCRSITVPWLFPSQARTEGRWVWRQSQWRTCLSRGLPGARMLLAGWSYASGV